MVNNKKQLFWLFSLVVCVACKIFIWLFWHGAASSFQSSIKNKNKNNCLYLFLYAAILLSMKVTIYLGKSKPASKVTLNNNTQSNVESHNGNIVALNGYYCLLQAQASNFKNWWPYDFSPGAPLFLRLHRAGRLPFNFKLLNAVSMFVFDLVFWVIAYS